MYVPVNARSGKGRVELRKFWNYVNECSVNIGRGSRIVLIVDIRGRVGNSEVAGVVEKWDMDAVNVNSEYLVDTCTERELFLANTYFQQKMIYRYKEKER